ncbi:hypothetical protein [Cellulosilyticum ruminicola]|uniref:hypothetical protein n=1 Tax=Cellulosilyticum ruminicola TaxID=425254 RepID=UPI0006D27E1A|nr:hypothetical protein [Cellulosilyticum ruminicola]
MYKNNMYTKKNHIWFKAILMLAFIAGVLVASFFILNFTAAYEQPTLVGTWVSTETDASVKFTEDEHVKLSTSTLIGTYHIISPNTMEYTIDGLTFIMSYHIEGRYLYWGMDEETLECFKRR